MKAKRKVEGEEIRKIKDVPENELFRCIDTRTGMPQDEVYRLEGYDCAVKHYEAIMLNDANQYLYLRSDRKVLVGFTL